MKNKVKMLENPQTEAQHQINLMRWTLINRNVYPELALLHHIPNGGSRDYIEAKRLKEQGLKAGVPDLCLPVPRGIYHGLYLELKTDKGKLSDSQEWWLERLRQQGYYAIVCHGWHSAVQVVESYLKL